ncbi:hypothetical protein [Streptococcus anginosus]
MTKIDTNLLGLTKFVHGRTFVKIVDLVNHESWDDSNWLKHFIVML